MVMDSFRIKVFGLIETVRTLFHSRSELETTSAWIVSWQFCCELFSLVIVHMYDYVHSSCGRTCDFHSEGCVFEPLPGDLCSILAKHAFYLC